MANKVRCRVEMKHVVRVQNDWDREKNFKILLNEFRRRCVDAGIMTGIKNYQHFESKARKNRKKLREIINKRKQEEVEEKLKRGEKVICSGKILKKIRSKERLNKKKDKDIKDYKDRSNRY